MTEFDVGEPGDNVINLAAERLIREFFAQTRTRLREQDELCTPEALTRVRAAVMDELFPKPKLVEESPPADPQ